MLGVCRTCYSSAFACVCTVHDAVDSCCSSVFSNTVGRHSVGAHMPRLHPITGGGCGMQKIQLLAFVASNLQGACAQNDSWMSCWIEVDHAARLLCIVSLKEL